jgi:hypothetical protein
MNEFVQKNEFKSNCKLILSILVQALANSTIHGIPKIIRTESKVNKFMWIVFVLISASFSSYMVIQSILNYFKYEVVTTVRIISEPYSEFPAVMFCNKNNLNKDYSIQLMNELFERNKTNMSFSETKIVYEALKSRIFSILTLKNETSKKQSSTLIDEMLIWCRFGGVECFD